MLIHSYNNGQKWVIIFMPIFGTEKSHISAVNVGVTHHLFGIVIAQRKLELSAKIKMELIGYDTI